jgi:hypothetical protein
MYNKEAVEKYRKSEKGQRAIRAAQRRYQQSMKGKLAQYRYREKFKSSVMAAA